MKITEGRFKGHDGTELFFRAWLSDRPQATMIMTHGMGEHSGAYTRFAEGIKDSGYNIFVWDLRGHGRSGGKRGVIHSWSDYTRDLVEFTRFVRARSEFREPLIQSAHSMGGLILLKAFLDHSLLNAKAFSLSSPLLGIRVALPAIKIQAARILAKVAPNFTMANEIPNSHLTHDAAVIAEYEKDKLRTNQANSVIYFEILKAIKDVFNRAGEIKLPCLVQISGADQVVSAEATKNLVPRLGSMDKTFLEYADYKHEIYNETGRAKVFADMKPWLARWTATPSERGLSGNA